MLNNVRNSKKKYLGKSRKASSGRTKSIRKNNNKVDLLSIAMKCVDDVSENDNKMDKIMKKANKIDKIRQVLGDDNFKKFLEYILEKSITHVRKIQQGGSSRHGISTRSRSHRLGRGTGLVRPGQGQDYSDDIGIAIIVIPIFLGMCWVVTMMAYVKIMHILE
tara:strand:+ start:3292 stop:3780 length:489 start_codon:yes stop_codon:yes gene_type:complete